MTEAAGQSLRLDKWLWHARFAKTRGLAAEYAEKGRVRLNGQPALKAHQNIRIGDVLTFSFGQKPRVIRVLGLGTRRGPAPEAQALYEDITPEG
ncbi:RNA-binding S4 domain-containing protein [Zavarzinia aquatilis]|uniref:RNA-binding protein n=1 Tax=Zavarzinia aquatilis TaxID=2211142 RepID=A0A317E0C4_9PROT|nr:RNA-binding S4 domain-containing protein [Zavarzinia aquatilis]PWR18605.1 RNA-binding protein [Zavarzinia aquatilis]